MSMGRSRARAMRWHRKGRTLAPGGERCLTKEKIAWARDSRCLKWCVDVRAGVNQYPSHPTTPEGWKRLSSSSIGAVEGWVLWLGVRQSSSSVLETEKDPPISRPIADMVGNGRCRRCMLPQYVGEATMSEK